MLYYLIIDFMGFFFFFSLFIFLFHAVFVLRLWAMYAECLNKYMFCSVLFWWFVHIVLQLKDCRHWPFVATYKWYICVKCIRYGNLLRLEKQNYCIVRDVTLVPYPLEKQNYCTVREVTLASFPHCGCSPPRFYLGHHTSRTCQ